MNQPNRRTSLKGLAFALGSAALSACSTTPTKDVPIRKGDTGAALTRLETWLRERMREHRRANLSLAVLDGDRITWSAGYGMADPASETVASAQTRYRAGSISKVFTAMAAMQLAEQGRLDLDAPLSEALPGFHMQSRFAGAPPVTPRLILQHRAGLPTDLAQGMWSDTPEAFSGLVEWLRDVHLVFPPGQVYAYSNVGFTLLGVAIEQVSGTPFAQWMQAKLLNPMGMNDSAFDISPPTGTQAAAALGARGGVEHEPGLRDMPAGGLNTTVTDLLQLARLWFSHGILEGRRVLTPRSIADMQKPPRPRALIDQATVGLGWHLLDEELDGVGPLLWHSGGTPHHHAELMLLPHLGVAVAAMSSTETAGELTHDAAREALTLMATARTGSRPTHPLRAGVDPAHPAAPLADYAGHYDTPVGVVRIDIDGEQASVEVMSKRVRLVRRPDGYTRLQYRLLGLFPLNLGKLGELAFTRQEAPDGQAWLLVRRKGRFSLIGTRLDPLPIPDLWRSRLGLYRYAGDDPFLAAQMGAVRLLEEAGLLLAEAEAGPESSRLALAPVNDSEAIVRGLGRSRGDTVRATHVGHNTILEYSGMRFLRQEAV